MSGIAKIVWMNEHGAVTRDRSMAMPCLRIAFGKRVENSTNLTDAVHLWGMIDTGTDYCHLPMDFLRKIGATSKGSIVVHGFGGNIESPLYQLDVILEGIDVKLEIQAVEMTFPYLGRPFQSILGKTLFQYGKLVLDQPDQHSEFRWVGDYQR
ncbi:hypothetical protein [Mesorhizobium sp. B2-4-8]|uniref:hypothetical protein n=1 Tax=Mesorhizobium sp. B2-4-8 TaxID=2589941 RepID=UPI00112EEAAF|nr:hypothetical protein [Mesorhizobium sp. B2-4-8]TPL36752.1 hypothetical protein FJ947_10890 [Mesorhizobium sp. B2-4-8]